MMKFLIIFIPVSFLLSSCSPTWKTNEYVKISETEHKFGQLEHAESYIKQQLLKNQTQKPLGLYVSSSLNDGTHGYRHKHGHYHFGKTLSYKQTRAGNKGSRSYFQWKFDPKAGEAQFYEFAKVIVSYPYKNSTDDAAENVSLEIFTSPKRIDKELKVNSEGIVINGLDFQKSNSLKGLDSYQYKKTDFDSIARSSYNVKSQIGRMEANIPSALSSLSQTLNTAQGEVARREHAREQERIRLLTVAAEARSASSNQKSQHRVQQAEGSSKPNSKNKLALQGIWSSKYDGSNFKSPKARDAYDKIVSERKREEIRKENHRLSVNTAKQEKFRQQQKEADAKRRAAIEKSKAEYRAAKARSNGGAIVDPD